LSQEYWVTAIDHQEQMVEHFTIPELAAVARFYATPDGLSVMRKMLTFTTTVTPMLEAEVVAWARLLTSPGQAGGEAGADDSAQRPIQ